MSIGYDAGFAAALLDPARAPPAGLSAPDGPGSAARFAIYRNNVTVGLTAALAARFPATRRIVGAAFFTAMAQLFIRQAPPRSPVLSTYGDALPDFLAAFPPVAHLAYLPDVARIEAARTRAYHAADAAPLSPAGWRVLAGGHGEGMRIDLHPAMAIIRSPHPIVTIWEMNQPGGTAGPIPQRRPQDALIARPSFDMYGARILVTALPPGGAAFLEALAAGSTLVAAAAAAASPQLDLADLFAIAMRTGLAVAIRDEAGRITT